MFSTFRHESIWNLLFVKGILLPFFSHMECQLFPHLTDLLLIYKTTSVCTKFSFIDGHVPALCRCSRSVCPHSNQSSLVLFSLTHVFYIPWCFAARFFSVSLIQNCFGLSCVFTLPHKFQNQYFKGLKNKSCWDFHYSYIKALNDWGQPKYLPQ